MTTKTQDDIRTALVEALQTSGLALGTIHAYERWAPSWEEWLNIFSTEVDGVNQIRAWEITGPRVSSEWYVFGKVVKRIYTYTLIGHISMSDADQTALVMSDLADRVMDYLDGVVLITENEYQYGPVIGPCQLTDAARTEFGNVLCEHCAIDVGIELAVSVA